MTHYDDARHVVVVGAGAAGLMAAIAASSAGVGPVIVLERSRDGGRKILISGGGRCNVLPAALDPRDFVTASSPNSLRKLLLDWPLADQRRFFEERLGIPLALEAETGKLFPLSNRARDVRDSLVREVLDLGGHIRFNASVEDLVPPDAPKAPWTVVLAEGERVAARAVILASGGLSVPATGSDGTGLRILARLGHTVNPLYPALAPLIADPPVHADLAGVSLDVTIEVPGVRDRNRVSGGFLFTHRGYSGPAVLNLSHLATLARLEGLGRPFLVRWSHHTVDDWDSQLRANPGSRVRAVVRESLPQ